MPHAIILDKGNCVISKVQSIMDNADALHDYLHDPQVVRNRDIDAPIEAAIDSAQALLTNLCGGNSIGSATLSACITELEAVAP